MNRLYESLYRIGVVIVILSFLYFLPELRENILFALIFAFLMHYLLTPSMPFLRKNPPLSWLQTIKGRIRKHKVNRMVKKAIERTEEEKYRKVLIENALENAKSTDVIERKLGLEQLSQLEMGDYYVYEKLLEILKRGVDKQHEEQIIDTLYKISKM